MLQIKRLLTFCLLLSVVIPLFSVDAQSITTNESLWLVASPGSTPDAAPLTQVQEIDTHTMDVTITFSGVWAQVQTGIGQSYTRLWHEEYSSYREAGQPALPGVTFNILIPQGSQVEVLQQDATSHAVQLSKQSLPGKIIPAQRQVSKSEPPPPWTPPDPARYASRSSYPQNWYEVNGTFQMRDYTILPLWINTVRYRPANGEIELLEKIELRLTWPESSAAALDAAVVSDSPSFDRLVSQIVINPPPVSALDSTKSGESYLIITPDEFETALAPFILMKQTQGYSVDVTLLSKIPGFDGIAGGEDNNILAIQNYIKSLNPPPVYLLLVGDTNLLPATQGLITGRKTDLYFTTIDVATEDEPFYVPDIFIGRLPARSQEEVTIMVNKLISYYTGGYQPWHSTASFIATCDNNYDHNLIAEGSHNYVINYYTSNYGFLGNFPIELLPPGGDQLYCVSQSATSNDVIENINLSRGIVSYSGHGNKLAWYDRDVDYFSDGTFVIRELLIHSIDVKDRINNYSKFSFVASFACETNDFGSIIEPIGFGETWMLQANKGAIAFIGSADFSYWNQDDILERSFYDTLFENPLNPTPISVALFSGLTKVQEQYPGTSDGQAQYYWETYNLLGDPSQQLWLLPRNLFYLPIIYK